MMEEWETFGLESTGEGRLGEKETVGWKAEGGKKEFGKMGR
jgi:hypothetical protein